MDQPSVPQNAHSLSHRGGFFLLLQKRHAGISGSLQNSANGRLAKYNQRIWLFWSKVSGLFCDIAISGLTCLLGHVSNAELIKSCCQMPIHLYVHLKLLISTSQKQRPVLYPYICQYHLTLSNLYKVGNCDVIELILHQMGPRTLLFKSCVKLSNFLKI